MATSGSVSTGGYQGRYLKLTWERTSYSVANNTSTISWTLKGAGTASSSWYKAGNFKVVIAGDTVYETESSDRITLYNGTTVKSGTKTIKHNTDGTKSFTISVKGGIYTYARNVSGSKTFTLNTIPRASSVSATAANVGAASTITISRASSAFTHTLTYAFGDLTGTIATKTDKTSVSWTLPDSFYAQMKSVTSKEGTITCTTYNGSTQIGDAKTCKFTAKVPSSQAPTVSVSISAIDTLTNTLCGTTAAMVKGISTMRVVATGTAKSSASISSYAIVNGSTTKKTATADFAAATNNKFKATVTDSRGYSASEEITFTPFVDYITLTNSFSVKLSAEGVLSYTIKGNYYNGKFVNNANTLTVQYRYKEDGGTYSDWTTITPTLSGNTYSYSGTIEGLDYKKTYFFQSRAIDKVGTKTAAEDDVNAIPIFDWGANDFHFHVPIILSNSKQIYGRYADETPVVMASINTSNQMFFGYGGYSAEVGSTYFDGNAVYIRSKGNISNTASGTIGGNKAWTNSSDKRLKTGIEEIPPVFAQIWMELTPKMFEWNEKNFPDGKKQFGLIAQEAIEVFEKYGVDYKELGFIEVVPVEETEYFAITYEHYHMLTAQVLKNTISELNSMKNDIAEIKQLVEGIQ